MKKITILALLIVLVGTSCSQDSIDEEFSVDLKMKADKILVCHYSVDDDSYKLLEINDNAISNHLEHGDVRLDDQDMDGYVPYNECDYGNMGDCDDMNSYINPNMVEYCGNGIDDDCDGMVDEEDSDGCVGIGDEFQGGILAYFFQSGDPGYVEGEVHGIIAAKQDLEMLYKWGCGGNSIPGALSKNLFSGKSNTESIVINCTTVITAAEACHNFENDYDDWFLPSINELEKLYDNKNLIGGFDTSGIYYWSSTEFSPSFGYRMRFSTKIIDKGLKSREYKVRPIRYF